MDGCTLTNTAGDTWLWHCLQQYLDPSLIPTWPPVAMRVQWSQEYLTYLKGTWFVRNKEQV